MHAAFGLYVQDKQVVLNGHVAHAQVEEKHMSKSARDDGPQGFGADLPLLTFKSARAELVQTHATRELVPRPVRAIRLRQAIDLLRRR